MNEILIKALAERVKAEQMTIEQVPEPLREAVSIDVVGGEYNGDN